MIRIVFILLFLPLLGLSQDLTIRNVTVSIPQGISMRVDNSVTNTGTLINHGKLLVGRNWINTGNYLDGSSGLLDLNGQVKQFIADSKGELGALRVSGGEKEIITDLFVLRGLQMSDTRLFVSDGYRLHLDEGVDLQYEDGDRVIGDLYMTGNDLTFPVGTMDLFLPIRLSFPDDQILEIGINARSGALGSSLTKELAELADFHWFMDCPEAFSSTAVEIGFEQADFLQSMDLASVAFSSGISDSVRNAGNAGYSGTVQKGSVTGLDLISQPYITLARRYADSEKPPLNVLNLVTPNDDGLNDYLHIENIEAYPNSLVSVFDRWGTKIYEGASYNNRDIRFEGNANRSLNRGASESGTYFYLITESGETVMNGFFELIR